MDVSRVLKGHFQEFCNDVIRFLQECYIGVSRALHGSYNALCFRMYSFYWENFFSPMRVILYYTNKKWIVQSENGSISSTSTGWKKTFRFLETSPH